MNKIIQVIIVLSTIVYKTDCCSSRILLFNQESFRMYKEPSASFIDYELFHKRNEYAGSASSDVAASPSDNVVDTSLGQQQEQEQQQQQQHQQQLQRNDEGFAAMRNVLSLECEGLFRKEFCLQGRCFRFPIGNQSLYSCECFDGYVGERCEAKSVLGSELVFPTIPTIDQEFKRRPPPKMMNAGISLSFPILIGVAILHNMAAGGGLKLFKRRTSLPVQIV